MDRYYRDPLVIMIAIFVVIAGFSFTDGLAENQNRIYHQRVQSPHEPFTGEIGIASTIEEPAPLKPFFWQGPYESVYELDILGVIEAEPLDTGSCWLVLGTATVVEAGLEPFAPDFGYLFEIGLQVDGVDHSAELFGDCDVPLEIEEMGYESQAFTDAVVGGRLPFVSKVFVEEGSGKPSAIVVEHLDASAPATRLKLKLLSDIPVPTSGAATGLGALQPLAGYSINDQRGRFSVSFIGVTRFEIRGAQCIALVGRTTIANGAPSERFPDPRVLMGGIAQPKAGSLECELPFKAVLYRELPRIDEIDEVLFAEIFRVPEWLADEDVVVMLDSHPVRNSTAYFSANLMGIDDLPSLD